MDLSLVLPVYNGESFIIDSVKTCTEFLEQAGISFEVIVVNDGSKDQTQQRLNSLKHDSITVINLPVNKGKGHAVKKGILESKGDVVVFTDADLPFSLEAVTYSYELIRQNRFHVVLGDRTLPASDYFEKTPLLRRFTTRIFSSLVRLFVTGEIYDTQCGFKAFRGDIGRALFELITIDRFAFDVELIYVALKYNLAIRRIPLRSFKTEPSTVQMLQSGAGMMYDIIRVPINWRASEYRNDLLSSIHKLRYWD